MNRMIYTTKHFLLIALMISVVLASGCYREYSEGTSATSPDDNFSNLNDSEGTVGLVITPPATTGLPVQHILDLDLQTFEGKITLRGTVRFSGKVEDELGPVESWISLIPMTDDVIPGLSYSGPSVFTDSETGSFTIVALTGVYDVFVYPEADEFYPPLALFSALNLDKDLNTTIQFMEEKFITITGVVTDAEGYGIGGIEVWAEAKDASPKRRSNLAVTEYGGYAGTFTLLMPDSDGDYTVYFSGRADDEGLRREESTSLYPMVSAGEVIEILDGELVLPQSGKLELAFAAFEKESCSLSGMVVAPDGSSVADAKVFVSAVEGGGVYERSTRTDESGSFSMTLLRSSYEVKVTPPVDSNGAFLVPDPISCTGEKQEVRFDLSSRIRLGGLVTDIDGQVLAGVEVRATRKPGQDNKASYTKSTFTYPDGTYALAVDPGIYDLEFVPSTDTTFARAFLGDVAISTEAEMNQQLAEGSLFSGTVVGVDGMPMPNAHIEAYRIRAAKGTSEPIGSGSTDMDGNFAIVLP